MMRCKHGLVILCVMVMFLLHSFPAFADEWVLGEVHMEGDYQEDYLEDYSVASGSNATGSNADYGIMLLSSYNPYDFGSISSTVVNYMSDVVPKLGNVHYVLFRAGQYDYRLYYSKDMVNDGAGGFSASEANYISYDSRYYTWNYGTESDFSLEAGSVLVYSDLGGYPMLSSGDSATWLLVLLGTIYLLFVVVRSFMAPSKYVI